MSNKHKGSNAEREIIHLFWSKPDWCAVRVAGSGSMQYPSVDIIASNKSRILAIECKATREDSKYIEEEQVEQLMIFSKKFGARPVVAIKFLKTEWLFLRPEELKKVGKNFVIDKETAEKKGIKFKDLIASY